MCGIAGIYRPHGSNVASLKQELAAMGSAIAHRGPDTSGIWHSPDGVIGLAHQRLSIQDLSSLGDQPMHSPSGRYVIVFNGEIYNFLDLRDELTSSGVSFRGRSDTEVVLAAVEQWGLTRALERFVGMFALALWDTREHTLYLARDRIGEKPLYYGWQGQSFVFGSELKALRCCRDWQGEIAREVLPLFVRHNYIPAPCSIYQGIFKLRPGTYLALPAGDPSAAEHHTYWSAQEVFQSGAEQPLSLSPQATAEQLELLIRDSIRQQMISDVPLGAFLSGGVDSSAVVAIMQSISTSPIRTFSIGFEIPDYNEADDARRVAQHLGTVHTELYVTPRQALEVIPSLPQVYDEPFADSSQIPTCLVARLAREHVTVSLSGDGGDELFGGYDRYPSAHRRWQSLRRIPAILRSGMSAMGRCLPEKIVEAALTPFAGLISPQTGSLGERFRSRMNHLASKHLESLYRQSLSLWTEPELVVPGVREPANLLTDPRSFLVGADDYQRMMYLDVVTYLPDDILVKVDRAAMAVSLETRIPLLDHRIVEFASRIPTEVRLSDGRGKAPLRQLLYRYVPRELIDRPKRGFAVPLEEWLRGPLRDWAGDLLHPHRLQQDGWFDPARVQRKWSEHQSGRQDWSYCLWGVLMFQAWCDAQTSAGPFELNAAAPSRADRQTTVAVK